MPLIGDAIYTLIGRLVKRENIFQAHRSDLYQRLQQSGGTHSQVASAYLLLTSLIALLISITLPPGTVILPRMSPVSGYIWVDSPGNHV